MAQAEKTHGYYHVSVTLRGGGRLLHSNNERAFVVSQLQDMLSPRLLLNDVPAHKQLASCIDLLTFSLRDSSIQLIVFTIDQSLLATFLDHILSRLIQYRSEYTALIPELDTSVTIDKLAGPHQALAHSVNVHLLHEDWEYDRYSSIGFYLHDRRGDWMRTWRLAQLFESDSKHYRDLLLYSADTRLITA